VKATILFITWRDDKVVCAEIYGDLDCSSIHVAEAYVVLALFFKCFEMEIKDLVLWTNFDISGPPKEAVLAHRRSAADFPKLGPFSGPFAYHSTPPIYSPLDIRSLLSG